MLAMGCPDKPVEKIEEDLFNVSTYVNGLCSFVRSCDTPMTISIQGDWGSGKTSMMNMMKENLQGDVWPVWFNTWQFSQFEMGNALAFSMLDVLLTQLDCDGGARKKILKGLAGFGRKMVKVATDVAISGSAADMVDQALEGDQETDYAAEIMGLKEKFQNAVNTKLEKENKSRVVIFVDDLDRLQPSRAVELLEVLKLFLDCDRCVFILAVDYEVVTLGIREKFGSTVSEEKGRSFFDKIIQLPFKMPVSNYNISRYVQDMMTRMNLPINVENITLFENLIHTSVGFNPRSMKRLFNTYQLLDIVTRATVRDVDDNVRRRVLFAIVCAQMSFEKLYVYLASTRLEADSILALKNPETSQEAIKEIYDEKDNVKLSQEISRVTAFMPYFINALQVDTDENLSDAEIENLRKILKSSLVTSVSNTAGEGDESAVWAERDADRNIVKNTAALLTDIGEFRIWLPRKEREGVRLSDADGYYCWTASSGFDIKLEFYVSRLNTYEVGVSLFVTNNSGGTEDLFFETLGADPLKLSRRPVREDWGRYRYENILRLNDNDPNTAHLIADIVRNAYRTLKEY